MIKTTFRKVVCLIAAVLLMGSITVAAVPELREWFVGLFITQNDVNADIKFANGSIDNQTLSVLGKLMVPTYIPDGFTLTDEISDDTTHIQTYENDDKHIEFVQNNISTGININSENMVTENVEIQNNAGYISLGENNIILVWHDNEFSYSIVGNLSKSDIINMANSVKVTK